MSMVSAADEVGDLYGFDYSLIFIA